MGHLAARPLVPALDIEAFICLAAVQDGLIAAQLLGEVVEGSNDAEPELLALLVLVDGNVFDVASRAERVDAVCRRSVRQNMERKNMQP